MEAEIVEKDKITLEKPNPATYLGGYAVNGGPGRPPGSKNKFTMVKEALVDAFNEAGGAEAFKNTLIQSVKDKDNKDVKYINLKALNAVLRVLPREDAGTGNTYNFNLIVTELRKLGPEQLRTIIARGRRNVGVGGGESPSDP